MQSSKVDKKRKLSSVHGDTRSSVLEEHQTHWHPAQAILERLSALDPLVDPDSSLHQGLRPSLLGPCQELSACVTKMLCQGQSTSLAVIGPPGAGKSLV